MFAFISASSAVLMGELGLDKTTFALVFALTSCGMAIGSAVNTRLIRYHVSSPVILRGSLTAMFAGAAVALALSITGHIRVVTLFPLMACATVGWGMVGPNASHESLANLHTVAGFASGILRSSQMLFGMLASAIVTCVGLEIKASIAMTGVMLTTSLLALFMNEKFASPCKYPNKS